MKRRKKIIITGIVSLLGRYLTQQLTSEFEVIGIAHRPVTDQELLRNTAHISVLDITNKRALSSLFSKHTPDAVIHLAALSNIDYCQHHPQETKQVNVEGTRIVANLLNGTLTHLIFLSSNAVFDGLHPPYDEQSQLNPLNVYGSSKMEAEEIIRANSIPTTIIRATSMFGWPPIGARGNDVTYYLPRLRLTQPIYLVDDRFFNPVSVKSATAAIVNVIKHTRTGIFHVAGQTRVNRYQFIQTLSSIYRPTKTPLIPVHSDYFDTFATRPQDGTLLTNKMKKIIGVVPGSLREELMKMKAEKSNVEN